MKIRELSADRLSSNYEDSNEPVVINKFVDLDVDQALAYKRMHTQTKKYPEPVTVQDKDGRTAAHPITIEEFLGRTAAHPIECDQEESILNVDKVLATKKAIATRSAVSYPDSLKEFILNVDEVLERENPIPYSNRE